MDRLGWWWQLDIKNQLCARAIPLIQHGVAQTRHRYLLSVCAREAVNISKGPGNMLDTEISSATTSAWPCILQLLVWEWCFQELFLSSPVHVLSMVSTKQRWRRTGFPVRQQSNVIHSSKSVQHSTEGIFLSQSRHRKAGVFYSVYR